MDVNIDTHIILDNNGDKVSVYRKIHLFDVVLSSKVSVMESKFTEAGSHIVPPVSTPIGKLGLTIVIILIILLIVLRYSLP